jgi:hypothetical protein
MFPHERSLVKKFANKPFVLLGVNSDPDRQTAHELVSDGTVTWRSWWDGPEGTDGPIDTHWEINGWPAFFIIDAEGMIRVTPADGPGSLEKLADFLEETITKLVHEAERSRATKGT